MSAAYSADLHPPNLLDLVAELPAEAAGLILEAVDHLSITSLVDASRARIELGEPARWERGRLFTSGWELQWQRRGDLIRSVLVTDGPPDRFAAPLALRQAPGAAEPLVLARLPDDLKWPLWGERRSGQAGWYQPRIHRRLDYPVPAEWERVAARVAAYAEQHDPVGLPCLYRFVALEPWP